MREGKPMKKWSLLSIPLVGLASISVWAQAVAGAPADQFSGVVVREPVLRDSKRPGQVPIPQPNATSPTLKSGPLSPATSPATKAAEAPDATPEDGVIVERVEPAQVTSPAVPPTDDSTSSTNDSSHSNDSTSGNVPDHNGGLSGNKGTGGGSND
jgi:hypothetical protein